VDLYNRTIEKHGGKLYLVQKKTASANLPYLEKMKNMTKLFTK
jgi:hypothetical protein